MNKNLMRYVDIGKIYCSTNKGNYLANMLSKLIFITNLLHFFQTENIYASNFFSTHGLYHVEK